MSRQDDILEENLGRLLAAQAPASANEDLWRMLQAEVRHRHRQRIARRWAFGLATAAAAAVVVIAVLLRPDNSTPAMAAGEVGNVQGLAYLKDGRTPQPLASSVQVSSGESLQTSWGSQVELTLADRSKILLQPHSLLRLLTRPQGQMLSLEQGLASIEAAKQPPGKSLLIQTPGAQVTVLGTKLDVNVIQKGDGRTQTRVAVREGRVCLASGRQQVILLPNMEGVVNEGQAPTARSLTMEVNELRRLMEQKDRSVAPPAIVEYNGDRSATMWSGADVGNDQSDQPLKSVHLRSVLGGRIAAAYTPEGAELPVAADADGAAIDLSTMPLQKGSSRLLWLQVADVPGLFADDGSGSIEFIAPHCQAGQPCMWQFRLPAAAHLQRAQPEPLETKRTSSRLVITVATDSQLSVFEQ